MKTFKFEVPYHQRRARIFTGWAKCSIDAENLGEALRIFEYKSRDGDYEEFGTYIIFIDDSEQDQEISHRGPFEYSTSDVVLLEEVEHKIEEEPKEVFLDCVFVTGVSGKSLAWVNGELWYNGPKELLRYITGLNAKGISVKGYSIESYLMLKCDVNTVPGCVKDASSLKSWYKDRFNENLKEIF